MTGEVAAEMPRYQCHKKVWALKIDSVSGTTITPADKRYAPFDVPAEMFLRYVPVAGDYYVLYADKYASFSPAKAFEEGYTLESEVQPQRLAPEQIARVCHEVNRAYCEALGDYSQPAWEAAPQWQRDSAMLGVKLHTDNPSASAAASHESWMAQKVADGWKWGAVKDPEAKTHPCIVPFDALPATQQAKDFIFRAVVHALAHGGGQ